MTEVTVKGWCPGAYRPMASGDGLVVRIRPRFARLDAEQALGVASLATRFGSGYLDLTNRANLQIRGVAERDFEDLLQSLNALGLLDSDPGLEQRRNILVTPFWNPGDLTCRLTERLLSTLPSLPDLPAKVGFAVDTGPRPVLSDASADFSFELGPEGLLLRADGTSDGRPVTEETAVEALIEMATWFDAHRTTERRRVAQVIGKVPIPGAWTRAVSYGSAPRPTPGSHPLGTLYGSAFGQIEATALTDAMHASGATALRLTPWRMFLLEGAAPLPDTPFITDSEDRLLAADACPGAPHCAEASVETRKIARRLSGEVAGSLHVSGCAKGCAKAGPTDVTLVGRAGKFDVILNGRPSDAPTMRGLASEDVLDFLRSLQ